LGNNNQPSSNLRLLHLYEMFKFLISHSFPPTPMSEKPSEHQRPKRLLTFPEFVRKVEICTDRLLARADQNLDDHEDDAPMDQARIDEIRRRVAKRLASTPNHENLVDHDQQISTFSLDDIAENDGDTRADYEEIVRLLESMPDERLSDEAAVVLYGNFRDRVKRQLGIELPEKLPTALPSEE